MTSSSDSSGNIDRPAGPLSSRISTARPADTSARTEMPLAPKEPSKKSKRGDTGYQRAKKVKPITAPRRRAGGTAGQGQGAQQGHDEEAPRRSRAMIVLVVLLVLAAGTMLYVNSRETPVAERSMALALDGLRFQATASFGIDLPPASSLTVSFSDTVDGGGSLGVVGGCNQISGQYRLGNGYAVGTTYGGTLESVDGWAQTEMACDQPLMDLDAAVVDLLSDSPRVTLVGATLTVTVTDVEQGPRSITFERVT